jgi:CRISPR-associated endonuclease/helicase Cas3
LIDDSKQRNIIVPFDDGEELIALLKSRGPDRWLLRKLQRYSVNIYVNDFNELLSRGSLEEIHPGIFALKCKVEYDDETGLVIQDLYSPESYMV